MNLSTIKKLILTLITIGALFTLASIVHADSPNYWLLNGTHIEPLSSLWGVQIPSLGSQNCIGTSAAGILQAGSCSGGGGSPSGSSYQLQYNNGGSFGASGNLNWANLNTLTITGSTTISNLLTVGGTLGVTGTSTLATTTITNLTVTQSPIFSSLTGCTNLQTNSSGVPSCNNTAYLTGNQTITLSGVITGSGATSIVTSFGTTTPYFTSIVLSASSSLANASSTALSDSGNLWVTGQTSLGLASTTGFTISGPLWGTGLAVLATTTISNLTVSATSTLNGVSLINQINGIGIPSIPAYPNATGTGAGASSTPVLITGSTDIQGEIQFNTAATTAANKMLVAINFGTPRQNPLVPCFLETQASSTVATGYQFMTASSTQNTLQIWAGATTFTTQATATIAYWCP